MTSVLMMMVIIISIPILKQPRVLYIRVLLFYSKNYIIYMSKRTFYISYEYFVKGYFTVL